MRFCECNSRDYRWRDVALINGKYYKVDEEVFFVEDEKGKPDATFDVSPIESKLAVKYGVDTDDVELATFVNTPFPDEVMQKFWGDEELGGYCAVCGGNV